MLMILRMTSAPTICMTTAKASIFLPIGSVNSSDDVLGIEFVDGDEQDQGQGQEDDAGEASFAGEGLDLPPDAEAVADQVADLVEDFRQVAAGLPLQETAVTKNLRSRLGMRSARLCRLSSMGMPRFCSSKTRLNSLPMGAAISLPTMLKPKARLCPAQSAGEHFHGVGQLGGEELQPLLAAKEHPDDGQRAQRDRRPAAPARRCPHDDRHDAAGHARIAEITASLPAVSEVSACSKSSRLKLPKRSSRASSRAASWSNGRASTLACFEQAVLGGRRRVGAGEQVQAVLDAAGRLLRQQQGHRRPPRAATPTNASKADQQRTFTCLILHHDPLAEGAGGQPHAGRLQPRHERGRTPVATNLP